MRGYGNINLEGPLTLLPWPWAVINPNIAGVRTICIFAGPRPASLICDQQVLKLQVILTDYKWLPKNNVHIIHWYISIFLSFFIGILHFSHFVTSNFYWWPVSFTHNCMVTATSINLRRMSYTNSAGLIVILVICIYLLIEYIIQIILKKEK